MKVSIFAVVPAVMAAVVALPAPDSPPDNVLEVITAESINGTFPGFVIAGTGRCPKDTCPSDQFCVWCDFGVQCCRAWSPGQAAFASKTIKMPRRVGEPPSCQSGDAANALLARQQQACEWCDNGNHCWPIPCAGRAGESKTQDASLVPIGASSLGEIQGVTLVEQGLSNNTMTICQLCCDGRCCWRCNCHSDSAQAKRVESASVAARDEPSQCANTCLFCKDKLCFQYCCESGHDGVETDISKVPTGDMNSADHVYDNALAGLGSALCCDGRSCWVCTSHDHN